MTKITLSGYLLVHQLACINRLKVAFNIFCPQKLGVKYINQYISIFHAVSIIAITIKITTNDSGIQ
ncbi:hypothetical protein ACWOB1_05805 [Facklamia languida]|uniref:hypothetical protein n=1 Tax=Facklamia languida TaxID=82347 RepID=UPI0018DBD584|nr:hypothetical protein [Facklamia languida]